MITFDLAGNLTPYEVIELNLRDFKSYFVAGMENMDHRNMLFENYLSYTKAVASVVSNQFFQWIDGSFVTQKTTPRDIDLVSFIDSSLIEKYEPALKNFVYPHSKNIYNVDAYLVKLYTEDDKKSVFSKSDTFYWLHHFQQSRPNKNGQKLHKGFIKIDLSHEQL